MTMNTEIAASVIARCRISSIENTLKRWGRFSQKELASLLKKKSTKAEIVKKVCQLIKQNDLNQEILGDLELSYVQLHSRCKLWKAYKLKGKDLRLRLDPRSLRSRLVNYMKLSWKDGDVHGNMNMFAGAIWLRFHFDTSRAKKKKKKTTPETYSKHQSVFAVLFQHSPFIILSSAKQRLSGIVSEGMKHVLGAEGLKLHLTGRHVASLADLVHKQHYEAHSTKYRDKEEKENPLCPKKRTKVSDPEPETVEGVIDENEREKYERKEFLKERFGETPQPELETLTYKYTSEFQGQTGLLCECTVEIKGPTVLDGICDAVKTGVFKCPLPERVTAVKSMAQNSFVLEGKKKK